MGGISTFLELERAVRWCRGFSSVQIKACNNLWRALRDDISQNSLYRVTRCLLQLGLEPMIRPRQLKVLVALSQGSDLALLWFLWEAYYKWPRYADESTPMYSYNEQLILTAIAYLDLPITLRGLDKLLPPPQRPKRQRLPNESKSPKRMPCQPLGIKWSRKPVKTVKLHKGSPYFKAIPRPQLFKASLSKAGDKTRRRVNKLTMQTCTSVHDNLRWFASYQVSPIKAEVEKCLSAVLDRLFQCVEGEPAPEQSLCHAHRMMEHTMQRRKQELAVAAKDRCMKLLDGAGTEQSQRSQRIVRQLEHEMLLATEKLEQAKQRHLMKANQLRQERACPGGCQICVQQVLVPLLTNNESDPAGFSYHQFPVLLPEDSNTIGHPLPTPDEAPGVRVLEWGQERLLKTINVGPSCDFEANSKGCPGPSRKKKPKACTEAGKSVIQLNVVQSEITTPVVSSSDGSHCFRRDQSTYGAPIWNFFRVYEPLAETSHADLTLRDMQPMIRGYCIAALHKVMQGSEEKKAAKVYGRRHIERLHLSGDKMAALAQQAAHECAKRHFAGGSSSTQLHAKDQQASEKAAAIDPNNRRSLLELLKSACETLKKDARYVLVNLPNAHMLPMLVDWAERRYGKTRKFPQIEKVGKYADKVHKLIQVLAAEAPLPEIAHVQWPTLEFIKRASVEQWKQIQEDFYKVLRFRTLEQSRLLWLALRNYSADSPVTPKTFFAYMPPRPQDILFRLGRQH